MFTNKWGKIFIIYSTMLLFCYNYTLYICSFCDKVNNSLSCTFLTSFSSENEIRSLSRLSPGHSLWSSGLIKRRSILMNKTCSIQIEFYTLLSKVCRMFTMNFSSKRKPKFQVIFGQDSFPLNTSLSGQPSATSANCLRTNGWWNACSYHYSFYTKVSHLLL